jgi:DNA-binding NarL/FixJ family response regulator
VPRHVLSRFVDFILNTARWQRRNSPAELSQREQQVLVGPRDKLANKEVADRLHISESTVNIHVSNLFAKIGVRCRADLILLCCRGDGAGR